MALNIEIPTADMENGRDIPTKTYKLDLDSKRIIGKTDGLDAVCQAIRKALATIRYEHLIYDSDYGCEAQSYINGDETSRELIETALPELIRDALLPDDRILSCGNFSFEFDGDSVHVSFDAETVYGNTEINTKF